MRPAAELSDIVLTCTGVSTRLKVNAVPGAALLGWGAVILKAAVLTAQPLVAGYRSLL
jgi:hypothetical protein